MKLVMHKKRIYIVFSMLLSCVALTAHAQKSTDSLAKKKIQVVDSIVGAQISGDFPKVVVATNVKDTVIYSLEDIAKARRIDSLWLNELKRRGVSLDNGLRKKIARRGWLKYHKYFNSQIISDYMINKIFDLNRNNKTLWGN